MESAWELLENDEGGGIGVVGGLIGALEVHVIESVGGVAISIQGGGRAD